MRHNYQGLPAAASIEQAIMLAQLLILRDLERQAERIGAPSHGTTGSVKA
jgi:hypothetical protein